MNNEKGGMKGKGGRKKRKEKKEKKKAYMENPERQVVGIEAYINRLPFALPIDRPTLRRIEI